MKTQKDNLIHASIAARRYGLPLRWLKEQARNGAIPALIAENQVLFDADILFDWLAKRARGEKSSDNQTFERRAK